MPQLAFGVDIDSILAELAGPVLALLNRQFGTSFGAEDPITQSGDGWIHDPAIRDFYFALFRDEAFLAAAPAIDGCQMGMGRLRELGEVHVITARIPGLLPSTVHWLETHGIPYDQLAFGTDKVLLAKERGITYFIEDTPEQAMALAEAGIEVFLFDYPWNRATHHPGVSRVAGWAELVAKLDHLDKEGFSWAAIPRRFPKPPRSPQW